MYTKKFAYTVEETMEALGLSRKMIYQEFNTRRLRSYKVGARRYVAEEDIQAYQDARRAEAVA
ncbi:MAG: helix-turn-helix domain-containing protein [Sedimenticola sp.]